eukprot:GFYU01005116.1.p1 GENE.GFYU01005116.1~~GFYU01005116.1.p1  ORF type:complete len:376 (+),score=117.52 GFYU01005116.1:71-1198(+)
MYLKRFKLILCLSAFVLTGALLDKSRPLYGRPAYRGTGEPFAAVGGDVVPDVSADEQSEESFLESFFGKELLASMTFEDSLPAHESDHVDTAANIGWSKRQGWAEPLDVTSSFIEFYKMWKDGTAFLPGGAEKFVYVLVGGLYTKHYPFYFASTKSALADLGLDVRMAPIDTDDPAEVNARVIADYVRNVYVKEGKKTVLIGHSKGCTDASDALSVYPDLHEMTRAFIAIQGPFGGSPLANDLEGSSVLRKILDLAIRKIFGGSPKALQEMTYAARQKQLAKAPFPADKVNTVCFVSHTERWDSLMAPTAAWSRKYYNAPSDGLVSVADADFPGAKKVLVHDVDHADAAFPDGFSLADYKASGIVRALVMIALRQ